MSHFSDIPHPSTPRIRSVKVKSEEKIPTDLSSSELESLLAEWSKIKSQISDLTTKEEKCKKLIHRLLDKEDDDSLYSDNYKVTRRIMSRSQIVRAEVPKDVWDQYSKKISYPVLYLKKI